MTGVFGYILIENSAYTISYNVLNLCNVFRQTLRLDTQMHIDIQVTGIFWQRQIKEGTASDWLKVMDRTGDILEDLKEAIRNLNLPWSPIFCIRRFKANDPVSQVTLISGQWQNLAPSHPRIESHCNYCPRWVGRFARSLLNSSRGSILSFAVAFLLKSSLTFIKVLNVLGIAQKAIADVARKLAVILWRLCVERRHDQPATAWLDSVAVCLLPHRSRQ